MLGEHKSKIARKENNMSVKRDNWTKDKIKSELLYMIEKSGLKRMPTSKEVSSFYGNYKLSNAISKRKMWVSLAKELGLEIKDSETAFGKSYEAIAMEQLICKGFEVDKMPQNFPYDLLINNSVKIDVKVSKLYKGTSGNFYSFNLEKPFTTCDIYILYLENTNMIKDILIIPSKFVARNTQISIGENSSKYYRFSQKWDYINNYADFNERIV